ncbi:MAG: Fic family protein, partial [Hydrogenothermaceae bacterium]
NSIMVEGYFISEDEFEKILSKNFAVTRTQEEALNYFRTANFIYSLAYENYKQKEFLFGTPLIRQINKGIGNKGEFRQTEIKISGAKFNPPVAYIEEWIDIFVEFVKLLWKDFDFNYLSVSHCFFEEIHPFVDGNGRTGRILLNYILISNGYPPVIIKGDEKNKNLYYKGLEEVDIQLAPLFDKYEKVLPDLKDIINHLKSAKSLSLRDIILNSLRQSLDELIISRYEGRGFSFEPVEEILADIGYSPSSSRQLIKRGKVIAIKRKNRWLSVRDILVKFLKSNHNKDG